jgi:hypothetical protein
MVSVSAATSVQAARRLPPEIGGIAIEHLSWGDVSRMAARARRRARENVEKLWLEQFREHLLEFVMVACVIDNRVFVVSLSQYPMLDGKPHTWIDVVEQERRYFHPVGQNWFVQPPNYVGFRYRGQLQSVHHVDSFEIVENLAVHNPRWIETDRDHFVYRLGPPTQPGARGADRCHLQERPRLVRHRHAPLPRLRDDQRCSGRDTAPAGRRRGSVIRGRTGPTVQREIVRTRRTLLQSTSASGTSAASRDR